MTAPGGPKRWTTLTVHGVGDPTWSHDGRFVYFQDFLETGKPIYRIAVPEAENRSWWRPSTICAPSPPRITA